MRKIPVIFDCDPGHDDAIALIMAFSSPDLDIKAVTVTAGNQTIEKTSLNAAKVLSFLGVKPLLAKGSEKPMCRDLEIAPSVHGESGLDGPSLPDPVLCFEKEKAWELSRKVILSSDDPVTIISTGPMTNTGILLTSYPEVKERIERIVFMGGGIDHGNWTPAAEFNILVDPEAADIVFKSGIPLVMCGLDVTEKALIGKEEIEEVRKSGRVGKLVAELLDFFAIFHYGMGFPGVPLHDPCASAYVLSPGLFETEDMHVLIETQGKLTTGMTFPDKRINPERGKPNTKVCVGIDRRGFVDLLIECCKSYG